MTNAMAIARAFTRWQAAGTHLLISAVIAVAVLAAMLTTWYPPPLFEAEGGRGLLFILVAVDVVIGPSITLIIFKPGKPGLRFDLSVIATLQMGALIYGCYVVSEARPVFIVFVKDQFEIVRAVELGQRELEQAGRPEFRTLPLTGPVLAAIEPPTDAKEREDLLFSALAGGKDMRHFPKYYVAYAEYRKEVLVKGQPLDRVRKREPDLAAVIEKYLADSGRKESDVLYLPLRARRGFIAALVDANTGELVKILIAPGLK